MITFAEGLSTNLVVCTSKVNEDEVFAGGQAFVKPIEELGAGYGGWIGVAWCWVGGVPGKGLWVGV